MSTSDEIRPVKWRLCGAIRCARSLLFRLAFLAAALNLTAAGKAAPPPNLLFILADDLGWNDLGCTGAKAWETPALDRLATQGMRFTRAYAAAPICSASRAGILTGRSPARLHLEFVTKPKGATVNATGLPLRPPPFSSLPLEEVTFGEVLQPAGYRTGFFGKWHVAEHFGPYLGWSPTHGPRQQGFAEAIEDFGGHTYGALAKSPLEGSGSVPAGVFPGDSMTDKAIAFLEGNGNRPFCLVVSHFFVHDPVRAPARWLFDKYRRRLQEATPAQAAYGAFVETLDHHVGRLLAAVDRVGLASNTVVCFTSDNGGAPGYGSLAPLRGCKWTLYEAGLRVPLLVRWPGTVRAGSQCSLPVTGLDLFPTFVELGGGTAASGVELDGRSLVALLRGQSDPQLGERELLWHFPYYCPEPPKRGVRRPVGVDPLPDTQFTPASALRRGDFKLVHDYESGRDELFDLVRDPGEEHNLTATLPELAASLRARLDAALKSVNARLPAPNTKPVGP